VSPAQEDGCVGPVMTTLVTCTDQSHSNSGPGKGTGAAEQPVQSS